MLAIMAVILGIMLLSPVIRQGYADPTAQMIAAGGAGRDGLRLHPAQRDDRGCPGGVMPQAIERALAVALSGGLLSVMLKLGTLAPAADPVFLTIVVAGGALNLYLVGAVANACLAAPGRSWVWRTLIGAVVALIAQAFSALSGHAPVAWDALFSRPRCGAA